MRVTGRKSVEKRLAKSAGVCLACIDANAGVAFD
jgi:hypothetical protein